MKQAQQELFDDMKKTKHAGGSPYARYKAAKGGAQLCRVGWLAFYLDDYIFAKLLALTSKDKAWRQKITEAINEVCSH